MTVDLNTSNISKTGPEMQALSNAIQGNILKSHGRGHTSHIFFTFNAGKEQEAKQFLSILNVTSASQQEVDKADREHSIFTGLYLTQKGYQFLGIADAATPDDFKSDRQRSMKDADLADPDVNSWETGYQDDIHGMVLIAWGNSTDNIADQRNRQPLEQQTAAISAQLTANGLATIFVERGDGIKRQGTGDDIEHFGYVDGISQPQFFSEDQTDHDRWNSMMPLKLVLTADPGGNGENAYGSYFVFRKLEQKVRDFKRAEQALASELNLQGDDGERAGAMVIGRFEDGTPITWQASDGLPGSGAFNNFTYQQTHDDLGAKCPYHAHIRKTNPRGDTTQLGVGLQDEKNHMMARRGIIYGRRNIHPNTVDEDHLDELPNGDVGLLFMNFQSNLANQFEFIQKSWANSEPFLSGFIRQQDAGVDTIIGQIKPPARITPGLQRYATTWGDAATITAPNINFIDFVTFKGGEYFFAPSMSFLASLAPAGQGS